MEFRVIDETETFLIGIGRMEAVGRFTPFDVMDKYMVVNREHGVVEYMNEVYYFARRWADQMEEALATLGKETPVFPPPIIPNGQIN